MNTEKAILSRILDMQLANIRPAARGFAPVWLSSTADWAAVAKIPGDTASKTFRPSIFFKVITIIVFGGATVLMIKEAIVNPQDKLGLIIFLICLVGGFFIFALYQFFLNRKINFSITLNSSGIYLAGDRYSWKDIKATGILTKGAARNKSRWLLIATGDGSAYKLYPLRLFMSTGGFPAALSKYIEYFKR